MLTRFGSDDDTAGEAGGETVGSIVEAVAVTAPPTATLRDAAEQMAANDVGLVIVTRAGAIAGVLSERDIVRAVADGHDVDEERVEDNMAVEIVSVGVDTSIGDAARMMVDGGIRHLPVTSDHRVVGVISMRDVFALG